MTRPRIELEVGAVAHGGHCVARHEGRVVFVRHALPGERVRAEVTDGGEDASFWRADAVEVLRASPDRVEPPCPWAGPGRCGGCDWQHASLPAQRALKADVVREQLQRLGGVEVGDLADLAVEPVPVPGRDADDGLRWRTRVRYAVDRSARAGLRAHRSHRVVPVDVCRIATTEVAELPVTSARWPGAASVEVAASGSGERAVVVEAAGRRRPAVADLPDGTSVVVARAGADPQRVRGRTWLSEPVVLPDGDARFRVGVSGFWQVHPGAGAVLAAAVVGAADPRPGETALDLYAGVGLLTLPLAVRVGPSGAVVSVESDARAVRDARRNLHEHRQVRLEQGRTERVLETLAGELGSADVVVLDPPRSGAGPRVVEQVVSLAPRVVVYVACDPAALGRDVRLLAERGYRLDGLRAFDLFPMTHHVECVARFVPA